MNKMEDFAARLAAAQKEEKALLLLDLINNEGQHCFEENVTQYAHAVQSAYRARHAGAPPALVVAALLHDVGHLLSDHDAEAAHYNAEDHFHENLGADVLAAHFPPVVAACIRLHVRAKRYLVTTEIGYYDHLSEASQESFRLQGGYMSEQEILDFEAEAFYREALELRKWDDTAKVQDMKVPEANEYLPDLIRTLIA